MSKNLGRKEYKNSVNIKRLYEDSGLINAVFWDGEMLKEVQRSAGVCMCHFSSLIEMCPW